MNKDQQATTLEACHFNAFRDHMMGQPIRGDNDSLQNINIDITNIREAMKQAAIYELGTNDDDFCTVIMPRQIKVNT